MVTLEPRHIELKTTFGTTYGFSEAKSVALIPTIALIEANIHFGGISNLTLSHTTIKDERENLVAKIGMEGRIRILAQPKPTMIPTTTTPRIPTVIINPRVDDKLEEIEATNIEE